MANSNSYTFDLRWTISNHFKPNSFTVNVIFDNLVPFFYTGLLQHFLIVVSAAKADKGRIIKEANLMIVRSQDDFEIPL